MRRQSIVKIVFILVVVNTFLLLTYWHISSQGHCRHLPRKYCAKGKLIKVGGYTGEKFWAVGYRLPENTPLFSPVEADLHISSSPAFILTENGKQARKQGVRLIKADEKGKIKYIISFIFATSPAKSQVRRVKRGEEIGRLISKPVYGDYNLLISVSTWDNKKRMFISDKKLIMELILEKDENE